MNWPTFFTRLGSAIVFCIIMMTGLLWNLWSFLALICLIQFLCLKDYFRLIRKIYPDTFWHWWMEAKIQTAAFLWTVSFYVVPAFFLQYDSWFVLIAIPVFFVTIFILATVLSKRTALEAALQSIGGIIYIVMPCTLLLFLRTSGFVLPLAMILMIWCNDTMAYLVGSFIGRTPFSPISPKKTWEGTVGGALLTIVGAAVCGYYIHDLRMVDWISIAAIVATAGTAGDLLESKLKRIADIKDSGKLMPGHGGALDRFDSLLVATPFVFAYVCLFILSQIKG